MSRALEAAVKAVGRVELWDGDKCVNVLTKAAILALKEVVNAG